MTHHTNQSIDTLYRIIYIHSSGLCLPRTRGAALHLLFQSNTNYCGYSARLSPEQNIVLSIYIYVYIVIYIVTYVARFLFIYIYLHIYSFIVLHITIYKPFNYYWKCCTYQHKHSSDDALTFDMAAQIQPWRGGGRGGGGGVHGGEGSLVGQRGRLAAPSSS